MEIRLPKELSLFFWILVETCRNCDFTYLRRKLLPTARMSLGEL